MLRWSSLMLTASITVVLSSPPGARAEVKYIYERGFDLASLSYQISSSDLINGFIPLRNTELSQSATNGYVPINDLPDPCAPSPLNSPNPGHPGVYTGACGDLDQTGARLTDGIAGAVCDTVLADFTWPAGVFQYDFPAPTDIGEIRVFAANTNLDGRVFQNYDVAISTDTNPDTKERVFTPLINRVITSAVSCATGQFGDGFFPNVNDGSQVDPIGATVTRVFDSESPILASGVTSVRFTFWAVSNTDRAFFDQWLGPIGCPLPDGENPAEFYDVEDHDGFRRAFEAPVIKEIDILEVRTGDFEICNNGQDDNGNGLVDADDPECFGRSCPPENCTNGIDDTGDGLVDCDDPDCLGNAACAIEICDNAADDDGDTLVDCDDPDCSEHPSCLCNDPVFDLDDDDDVDLEDFAGFQRCYTGPFGGPVLGECACLDLNDDGVIAEEDFARFELCASRSNVPANPACDD